MPAAIGAAASSFPSAPDRAAVDRAATTDHLRPPQALAGCPGALPRRTLPPRRANRAGTPSPGRATPPSFRAGRRKPSTPATLSGHHDLLAHVPELRVSSAILPGFPSPPLSLPRVIAVIVTDGHRAGTRRSWPSPGQPRTRPGFCLGRPEAGAFGLVPGRLPSLGRPQAGCLGSLPGPWPGLAGSEAGLPVFVFFLLEIKMKFK